MLQISGTVPLKSLTRGMVREPVAEEPKRQLRRNRSL
jgi:hypothetical protein